MALLQQDRSGALSPVPSRASLFRAQYPPNQSLAPRSDCGADKILATDIKRYLEGKFNCMTYAALLYADLSEAEWLASIKDFLERFQKVRSHIALCPVCLCRARMSTKHRSKMVH
jgi:hypothetical protein